MAAALTGAPSAAADITAQQAGSAGAAIAIAAKNEKKAASGLSKAMSMMAIGGNPQTDRLVENGLVAAPEKPVLKVAAVVDALAVWTKFYSAARLLASYKLPEPCYDYGVVHRHATQFLDVVDNAATFEDTVLLESKDTGPYYKGLSQELSQRINKLVGLLYSVEVDSAGKIIDDDTSISHGFRYPEEHRWSAAAQALMAELDKAKPQSATCL